MKLINKIFKLHTEKKYIFVVKYGFYSYSFKGEGFVS